MCFKRESMLAISRDSLAVSWPTLSRPPIKRPPMIQKFCVLPDGMSTAIGTDYGHADNAAEIEALRKLRKDGKLPGRVIDKILDDNPRALYGLCNLV